MMKKPILFNQWFKLKPQKEQKNVWLLNPKGFGNPN
jgi:hypothetical protein